MNIYSITYIYYINGWFIFTKGVIKPDGSVWVLDKNWLMKSISILGIFVADLVFFADTIPQKGETVLGHQHVIGPGGKGSNQAVAAAKAGCSVNFISKIGNDQ